MLRSCVAKFVWIVEMQGLRDVVGLAPVLSFDPVSGLLLVLSYAKESDLDLRRSLAGRSPPLYHP